MTGMSGTGKSSALERLRLLGFRTVDTDEGGWTEWSEAEGGYIWREERIAELLADDEGPSLYVSGTVSNQGRFYHRFDAIVLLSAPANILLSRIETRATNPYGKTAEQRERVLRDLAEAEPCHTSDVHPRDRRYSAAGGHRHPARGTRSRPFRLDREPTLSIEGLRRRSRHESAGMQHLDQSGRLTATAVDRRDAE